MKESDILYFKALLENLLQDLLSQADSTVTGMTTQKENFPDPTDRASLESDRNFMLRIRDREAKLIKKIKKAATEQQYHQAVDQLMATASPAAADQLRTTPASLV